LWKEVNGVNQFFIEFEFEPGALTAQFDYWLDFGSHHDIATVYATRDIASELEGESIKNVTVDHASDSLVVSLNDMGASSMSFALSASSRDASDDEVAIHQQNQVLRVGRQVSSEMAAGTSSDVMLGDDGDDTLHAGAFDHVLHGGTGNDALHSGQGNAVLIGGKGQDHFVIEDAAESVTYISDFAVGDKIDLTAFARFRSIDRLVISQVDAEHQLDENTIMRNAGIDVVNARNDSGQGATYITLGQGQKLFVSGVADILHGLSADDFIFKPSFNSDIHANAMITFTESWIHSFSSPFFLGYPLPFEFSPPFPIFDPNKPLEMIEDLVPAKPTDDLDSWNPNSALQQFTQALAGFGANNNIADTALTMSEDTQSVLLAANAAP